MKKLLLILFILLSSTILFAQSRIIYSQDFESAVAGTNLLGNMQVQNYNAGGGAAWTYDLATGVQALSGSKSAHLNIQNPGNQWWGLQFKVENAALSTVVKGMSYNITFKIKSSTSNNKFQFYVQGQSVFEQDITIPTANVTQVVSIDTTPMDNSGTANFLWAFGYNPNVGDVWIDDIVITEKYTPINFSENFNTVVPGVSNIGDFDLANYGNGAWTFGVEQVDTDPLNKCARLNITQNSDAWWTLQFKNSKLIAVQGKQYVINFKAKSNISNSLLVRMEGVVAFEQRVNLTNSFQNFSIESTAMDNTGSVGFMWAFGNPTSLGTIWIDDITIQQKRLITGGATANSFTTTYGTVSAAQTFPISGTGLITDITATAPTGFEVSSNGSTYGATATFTQTSGNISGTLSVRLAANAAVSGTYNSQNIVLSSTGTNSVNIVTAVSGNAVSAATASNSGGNLSTSGLTDLQLVNTNLTVSTGEFVIDATKTVRSLTVAPGAKLTLSSGTLTATSGITLQSDATGTATFVDNTTNSPQEVTATVQQYVTQGRNWYMSIPLASGASSLLNRGTSVVCFDEPSGTWIAPAANTLNKLRGYVQVATSTPSVTGTTGTVDFTGVVNTGAHSITLSRTAGKTGFNLVGNPYPSYLDWNAVTKTNVSNTMWFRTKEGGVYKFYTYNTVDGAGGIGVPASVTRYIPPMQAFWVRVATEGTGSIAVDNNMRSHKDVAGNLIKAPKQSVQQLLRLQVSNGTNTDETVLYFNANASDAFDQYDAQKRSNGDPTIPEIFTQVGNEQLVINGLNSLKYDTEIPLGFSTLTSNDFTISANELKNFETGTRVILIDKQNPSVENELTSGTAYNFSAPITTATTDRFSLMFRAPGITTGIDNGTKLNAQVFVNAANQIAIISLEKVTYSIYNALGQLVSNGKTITNRTMVNTIRQAGVYVVKLTENGTELTTRVIIK